MFKWGLAGHCSKNMEDSNAEDNLNYVGIAQGISESTSCTKDHSFDILAKTVDAFCSCQKIHLRLN